MEKTRGLFFLAAVLAALMWGKPLCPASANGGGMSLSEEIGARINYINSLPVGEELRIPTEKEMEDGAAYSEKTAGNEFFSSLRLDKILLSDDDLREIEEYREAMKNAGLGAEQIEEAVKGLELAKKMSAVGPGAMMEAGLNAAKKQEEEPIGGRTIGDASLPPAAGGNDASDAQEKARWALGLADSMAVATFYDIVDAGMVKTAGLAVSAYPHPLLLNNYAGMIREVSPDDALFFYFSALALEPRNPVIITNIAMAFLDRDDFGAARNYATQALSENPEFGPAFQVLTLCHLKDGNSVLAAETLMKSARDCFDDLSVRLFDDYIAEVGDLDVTEGEEYPLSEQQLEILYEIAKKYGDPERENGGADTPGAQIRINPFPTFGSADHYLNSEDFLLGDAERRTAKLRKISADLSSLEKAVFGKQGSRGALPVMKNMRQYYAYLVLESYYHFKMRELNWKLQEEDPTDDLLKEYVDAYMTQCIPFRKQEDDFHEAFLKQPKGTPKEEAEWYRKGIRFYSACLDHQKILLDITRRYTVEYLKIPKSKYDERKPLVEEFWLKAGGLMKYMTDRDAYDLADKRREMFAVDWVDVWPTAGYLVPNAGDSVFIRAVDEAPLGMSPPYLCSISPPALQRAMEKMQRYQEELAKLSKGLNRLNPPPKDLPKYAFDVDPVEIERTALPMFREAWDLPLIGFEGTLPFSDKHTAYTDGEKSTWIITGENGARGSVYDDTAGTMTTFSAAAKPSGSASVFDVGAKLTDLQELGDRLDKAADFVREKVFKGSGGKESEGSGPFGAPFKGADIMKKGQEAIGFLQAAANVKGAGSKMFGEYVTRDKNHRVIDHGLVYIRQVGGSLPIENSPELGREVMVMKSRITGVSTKQEFTQYKFKFATVRTR